MRWGKIVLLFQAFVTLALGIVFFSQVLSIDAHKITQAEITINTPPQSEIDIDLSQIKTRYSTATYILLFISLIELIIITRLLT